MQVLKQVVTLSTLMCLSSACGKKKPLVKDVVVRTQTVENELIVGMDANFAIGNVRFPQAQIPVRHPQTSAWLGSIELSSGPDGENFMALDLNLSAITRLRAEATKLPNGHKLPLIGESQVVVIPIKDIAKVYFSVGDEIVALGVTIAIKSFDRLGERIGEASLFPVFVTPKVFGSAGLYTSSESGKSGIGLFADITGALSPLEFLQLTGESELQTEFSFSEVVPTALQESVINKSMYRMHRRREELSIEE